MNSTSIFWGIADFFTWALEIFDSIGNKFNYSVVALGFFGMFYWLIQQKKLNAQAEKDSNQIK